MLPIIAALIPNVVGTKKRKKLITKKMETNIYAGHRLKPLILPFDLTKKQSVIISAKQARKIILSQSKRLRISWREPVIMLFAMG